MIYPILYEPDANAFRNNGLGMLSDAISCRVTADLGGFFELQMDYPATGLHFDEIKNRSLIKVKIPQVANPQIFRVYSVEKKMKQICTVRAAHISYDMRGVPVAPFTASGVVDVLNKLKTSAVGPCPFVFSTDKDTTGEYKVAVPQPLTACLRGQQGSLVDTFGGEYEMDNYAVKLLTRRGQDRGVVVRYGKNLTDLKQEQNCSDIASAVYPYWQNVETLAVKQLPEKIVKVPEPVTFDRTRVLDLTYDFETEPTDEQLRARALKFATDNRVWEPRVNLSVSYVQLEQTEEYKGTDLLERVELGDTVRVEFPALGVSAHARATKMVYDILLGRVEKVQLGGAPRSITDTLLNQQQEIEHISSPSFLQQATANATGWITNGKGYMVAVKDANGNWREVCSLDTPDIESAVNVWRWNNGGFGHSGHGYNGPYDTAITQDGHIVANFVDVGELTAAIIKTGILTSKNGKTTLNLDTGEFRTTQGFFRTYEQDVPGGKIYSELTPRGMNSWGAVGTINADAPSGGQTPAGFNCFYNNLGSVDLGVRDDAEVGGRAYPAYSHLELKNFKGGTNILILAGNGVASISGLTKPVNDTDAVNKAYVDALYKKLGGK